MFLRRQRSSFFHLGEEDGGHDLRGAQYVKSLDDDDGTEEGSRNTKGQRRIERDADVVGLRILVTHQHEHRQNARATHIVLKQMAVLQPMLVASQRHPRASCGFLRSCALWLCRRELSPDNDLYMYRGDQGFCSEECRCQQILLDEKREREAAIMKHRRAVSIQRHHEPRSAVRGAPPTRLLAVA